MPWTPIGVGLRRHRCRPRPALVRGVASRGSSGDALDSVDSPVGMVRVEISRETVKVLNVDKEFSMGRGAFGD